MTSQSQGTCWPAKAQRALWATAQPRPLPPRHRVPSPPLCCQDRFLNTFLSRCHLPLARRLIPSSVLLAPPPPRFLSGPCSPPGRIPTRSPGTHRLTCRSCTVGPQVHPPRPPSLSRHQGHQGRSSRHTSPAHTPASTPGLPGHGGVSSLSVLCQDRLEGKLWPRLLPSETDDSRPGTQSPRSDRGLGPDRKSVV